MDCNKASTILSAVLAHSPMSYGADTLPDPLHKERDVSIKAA